MACETEAADLIRLDLYPLDELSSPLLDDVIAACEGRSRSATVLRSSQLHHRERAGGHGG